MRDSMTVAEAWAEKKSEEIRKQAWEVLRNSRFHAISFFGVVDRDGHWVDSAFEFHTAVMFAAWHEGHTGVQSAEAVCLLDKLEMSVLHSSLLEKMCNAGLLK